MFASIKCQKGVVKSEISVALLLCKKIHWLFICKGLQIIFQDEKCHKWKNWPFPPDRLSCSPDCTSVTSFVTPANRRMVTFHTNRLSYHSISIIISYTEQQSPISIDKTNIIIERLLQQTTKSTLINSTHIVFCGTLFFKSLFVH